MKKNTPKIATLILIFSPVVLFISCLAFYVLSIRPWDSGVVASMSLPDGSKVMVTQTYNVWSEPYDVKLWRKRPGESWQSGYVDHEAGSWRHATMSFDKESNTIVVTEGGKRRIELDVAEGTYSLEKGRPNRERSLSAERPDPPFPFPHP